MWARIRTELRDARDRFVASDPGWARARQGLRAAVAVGTTLLLELGWARWIDRPAVLPMLMGAVIAAFTATGIRETRRPVIAALTAGSVLMAMLGVSAGVVTAQWRVAGLITFVVVSFVAVWIRRWGPWWLTFGLILFQGFFFSLFLHPPVDHLLFLLTAVLIAGVWSGLLLLTVLLDNQQAKLRSVVVAFRARARAGIAMAVEVFDEPGDARAARRMRSQLVGLREVALLLDGMLADASSLPTGVQPGRLRRWTVDVEIGMDEVCGAVTDLAAVRSVMDPAQRAHVDQALQALGWGDPAAARHAAQALLDRPDDLPGAPVHRLGGCALFLLDTVRQWDSGELSAGTSAADALDGDDFEPVVTLVGGSLPGTAPLAEQAISQPDARRWSPSRWRLTTRQAIQASTAAALAILAGEAISPQRFYWAVIAAFLTFAGTATSGESVSRGTARIAGTLFGLLAALGIASLTEEHLPVALAIILVCLFAAFLLQPISMAGMMFFITLLLGQLYTLLGTYSEELLLLRLEETMAGALIGIGVALLVFPAHSRATLRVAREAFLSTLAELLDQCAQVLDGSPPSTDLLVLSVRLDAAARQIVRTRAALTRGRLYGRDRMSLRHRVSVLSACGAAARALALSVSPDHPSPALASAARRLAEDARVLAAAPGLLSTAPPDTDGDLPHRIRALLTDEPGESATEVRAIRRLARGLSLLGPRAVAR